MSKRDAEGRAIRGFKVRYAPAGISGAAGWKSIATTQAFGPFAPGDFIVVVSDVPVHVNSTISGGTATTQNPQFPAGVNDLTVPYVDSSDQVYVNLLGGSAGNGCAYKAS